MKSLIAIASLVGIASGAFATTLSVTAPSSLNTLAGDSAYSWGVPVTVSPGQSITYAEIDFNNVTLTAADPSTGTGYLYTDLLKSSTTGVVNKIDNDAAGDYWATTTTPLTSIGAQFFKSAGTTLTWSYILTGAQLTALNSYLTAGIVDIGLDPDCHYSVGSITFSYSTGTNTPHTVPDVAATAFLFLLGFGGLELVRRQFIAIKAKA